MPLVDITANRYYKLQRGGDHDRPLDEKETRWFIRHEFASALPHLLISHTEELCLTPGTPDDGVQVMNHTYGRDDVNTANIWVKFQFSEYLPEYGERIRIRDVLFMLIYDWFRVRGYKPENLVIDLFWGPTNGKGTVNGVDIEW